MLIGKLKKGRNDMVKNVCDLCGYVYDSAEGDSANRIKPGTAFESLPADWVCPLCGAAKDKFYEVKE
jgi:rubredoxin